MTDTAHPDGEIEVIRQRIQDTTEVTNSAPEPDFALAGLLLGTTWTFTDSTHPDATVQEIRYVRGDGVQGPEIQFEGGRCYWGPNFRQIIIDGFVEPAGIKADQIAAEVRKDTTE